ncbi:MAG: PucC family protein, partial [Rhodopila sp.]
GIAVALGGIIRDVIHAVLPQVPPEQGLGYITVYALELVLLVATLVTMIPLLRRARATAAPSLVHS